MRKMFFMLCVIVTIVCSFVIYSYAKEEKEIKVILNGEELTFEVSPFIEENRTLVPFRKIFEALNVEIEWDGFTKTITAKKGIEVIKLQIGNSKAMINNVEKEIGIAPKVVDGRTFVPLRFISESLGAKVDWDSANQIAAISYAINTITPTPKPTVTPEPTVTPVPTITPIPTPSSLSLKEIITKGDAVVLLDCYDSKNKLLGSGSGIIVSTYGEIATNYHVIEGASKVKVTCNGGQPKQSYQTTNLIAYDIKKDIAILKLDADSLKPVILGDSDKMTVGDKIVAIGNPRLLQNTVSEGIISGNRIIEKNNYLQISAAISAGSSGGALFNMNGEVVGITTMQIVDSQNLNFAIPINDVKTVLASTGLKSLEQVSKENDPNIEYLNFAQELQSRFFRDPEAYKLEFDTLSVTSLKEYTDNLYITINVKKVNQDKFLQLFNLNLIDKRYVEKWMSSLANYAAERYPDKLIIGLLNHEDSYGYNPNDVYPSDCIRYNTETKLWDVFVTNLVFTNEDNKVFKFEWSF